MADAGVENIARTGMSKIRIYELARELGIDNKQVIACARKLGLAEKSSHSNSLEDDEADLIRRALLRDATGSFGGGTSGAGSQGGAGVAAAKVSEGRPSIIQRSVAGEVVVERRQGNVVHRRRKGAEGGESDAGPSEAKAAVDHRMSGGVASDNVSSRAVSAVDSSAVESVSVARTVQETHADGEGQDGLDAHAGADVEYLSPDLHLEETTSEDDASLASAHGELEHIESEDYLSEDRNTASEAQELSSTGGVGLTRGGTASDMESNAISARTSEASSTRDAIGGVKHAPAVSGPKVLGMITNFTRRTPAPPTAGASSDIAAEPEKSATSVEPQKTLSGKKEVVVPSRLIRAELPKTAEGVTADGGPKILGRIQLPVRKTIGRPDARWADEVSDEEEDTAAKRKGRVRKREISRKDLLDYEGMESRKMKGGKSSLKHNKNAEREEVQKHEFTGPKQSKRVVRVDEFITVGDLAHQMSLKAGDVISKLMGLGVMVTINQSIDKDTATIIAEEFDYQIESIGFDEDEMIAQGAAPVEGEFQPRPPVVTVMGHVDHGKTSLLDRIRKTAIADKEHGGITQHIGAYQVNLEGGRKITFLDTPGHAAFTAMRARGADITDVVILVVAADDGVMPQTIEAINHAKAANVPIVVAVNKIDKPSANPDRVKQQLSEHGLQPEEWGGDTMFVPVSALTGVGIDDLLEGVLLVAEMKELQAIVDSRARGTVIEAAQERGFGTVATILVQHGTLKLGDIFVAGSGYGRVRSLRNDRGDRMENATPSVPVRVTGFGTVPLAGDDLIVVESENVARDIAENRALRLARAERALESGPISLEEFHRRANTTAAEELNVILKADVHGSVEAVKQAIQDLSTDKVVVKVLHAAVGGITESDIQLAIASRAMVFGFGVRAEPRAMADAEAAGVTVNFYRVIYELVDAVKKAMVGLLAPSSEEVALGRAEVRDTFVVPKVGTIAGCYVSDGIIKRGALVRVVRDSRVIYQGKMGSLRRFKEDVKQVQSGYECGLGVENFNDVKVGDVFEVYELKEVAATL